MLHYTAVWAIKIYGSFYESRSSAFRANTVLYHKATSEAVPKKTLQASTL